MRLFWILLVTLTTATQSPCLYPVFTFVTQPNITLAEPVTYATFEGIQTVGWAAQHCLAEIRVRLYHILYPFVSMREAVDYRNVTWFWTSFFVSLAFFIAFILWIMFFAYGLSNADKEHERQVVNTWIRHIMYTIALVLTVSGFVLFWVCLFYPTNSHISSYVAHTGNLYLLLPIMICVAWCSFGLTAFLHAQELGIEQYTGYDKPWIKLSWFHVVYGYLFLFIGAAVWYTTDGLDNTNQRLHYASAVILIILGFMCCMYAIMFYYESSIERRYPIQHTVLCAIMVAVGIMLVFGDHSLVFGKYHVTDYTEDYFYAWCFFILLLLGLWFLLVAAAGYSIHKLKSVTPPVSSQDPDSFTASSFSSPPPPSEEAPPPPPPPPALQASTESRSHRSRERDAHHRKHRRGSEDNDDIELSKRQRDRDRDSGPRMKGYRH